MTKYSGHKWLCEAWGETDLPCACICADHAEVWQFLILEWLGDAEDPLLPKLMQEVYSHDWDEGEMSWTFETGGVSIKRVFESSQAKSNVSAAGGTEPVAIPKDFVTNVGVSKTAWAYKEDLTYIHAPWHVVLPNGAMLTLGYHVDDAVDKAHAEFIANAINQALAHPSVAGMPDAEKFIREFMAAYPEIRQLQDGWATDPAWTEWDETVRKRTIQLGKMGESIFEALPVRALGGA